MVFSKPMERKLIKLVFVLVIKKEDHILPCEIALRFPGLVLRNSLNFSGPFLPLERKKAIKDSDSTSRHAKWVTAMGKYFHYLCNRKWCVSFAVFFLTALLSFHFFFIGRYAEYPWWHKNGGNDSDALFVCTTIGLLNNSYYGNVFHPGATLCAIQGIAFRALSVVDVSHRKIFQLKRVSFFNDVQGLLNTATKTGRILSLIFSLLLMGFLFYFLWRLTQHLFLSFVFTFYIIFTPAYIQHSFFVRTELLTLLFLSLIIFMITRLKFYPLRKSLWPQAIHCLMIGILMAWGMFTKVQIFPLLILLGAWVFVQFFIDQRQRPIRKAPFPLQMYLGALVFNMFIFPWWAVRRPDWLTPEYLDQLSSKNDYRLLVGPAPEDFVMLIAAMFFVLFLIGANAYFLWSRQIMERAAGILYRFVCFIPFVITGCIIGIYSVLLPVSGSLSKYIENTRHLLYTVITNISYSGLLHHKIINVETFHRIFVFHAKNSPWLFGIYPREGLYWKINILFLVSLGALWSVIQCFRKNETNKKYHLLALFCFLAGIIMDVLISFRWIEMYSYYAIYSTVFYGVGVGLCCFLLWEKLQKVLQKRRFQFIRYLVLICFLSHVWLTTLQILQEPKASGISQQDWNVQYQFTRTWVPEFWHIVDQALGKSN